MSAAHALERGDRALREWSWHEARAAFEEALLADETPEALEGLGTAASWLDDADTAITARERAYRMYRGRDDAEAAARVAVSLADDLVTFRGEHAVASGWLQRARRRLEDRPDSPVLVWADAVEASMAMMYERDLPRALALAEHGVADGRRIGDVDAEMIALSLLGLVLVSSGRLAEGLRVLDEAAAAAVSGEVRDPEVSAGVCCIFVTASARIRDFDRLAQWSRHVMQVSQAWTNRSMFTYPRIEHAAALIWWGHWGEAEQELAEALTDMSARPQLAALAMLRLADLRRRQGRYDEARSLLEELEASPYGIGYGERGETVRAALALDSGDLVTAAEAAERDLRALPADDIVEHVDGLEVLVRARLGLGDREEAQRAADTLRSIADATPTAPIRASASLAAGLVSAARGEHAAARGAFETAIAFYRAGGAPFETARARIELARSVSALGQPQRALEEARKAVAAFEELGARADAVAAAKIVADLESSVRPARPGPLTARESEVLRMVAAGMTNDEIAAALVLSVRTIERHLSNIYAKIGATGRAARAAATSYAHTHAIA
ncbi:LuxR family transcriptional regulator [Agromyces albus]|uniref:LuxR family transcriptional regulator n=1 Tax=Agromyces albus TaxID=205332 RepID=UPI002785BD0C|nr:LuxR family transcriptional regulator [Agromyces albus]MDQ0574057.1 LuxR family maltose regulon positive regulatory protein [Agromyces albus]